MLSEDNGALQQPCLLLLGAATSGPAVLWSVGVQEGLCTAGFTPRRRAHNAALANACVGCCQRCAQACSYSVGTGRFNLLLVCKVLVFGLHDKPGYQTSSEAMRCCQ